MSRKTNTQVHTKRNYYRRRKAIIRKQRFILLLFMFFVISITTGFLVKKTYANDNIDSSSLKKVYSSIQIHSGDTLTSIGSKYLCSEMDTLDHYIYEIKSINHISDETNLIAGNYLIIPSYKCLK